MLVVRPEGLSLSCLGRLFFVITLTLVVGVTMVVIVIVRVVVSVRAMMVRVRVIRVFIMASIPAEVTPAEDLGKSSIACQRRAEALGSLGHCLTGLGSPGAGIGDIPRRRAQLGQFGRGRQSTRQQPRTG